MVSCLLLSRIERLRWQMVSFLLGGLAGGSCGVFFGSSGSRPVGGRQWRCRARLLGLVPLKYMAALTADVALRSRKWVCGKRVGWQAC